MVLSSLIIFISCFSIVKAEISNLPKIKFIFRSKRRLIIVVIPISSFNILITHKYFFFFSIIFFSLLVFAFSIASFWKKLRVKAGVSIKASIEIFLIGFYSPNLIFFGATKVFFFLIQ